MKQIRQIRSSIAAVAKSLRYPDKNIIKIADKQSELTAGQKKFCTLKL